jgi:hypothetical protein
MAGGGGHSGDSDWLRGKNREEFGAAYFRHLFASLV